MAPPVAALANAVGGGAHGYRYFLYGRELEEDWYGGW